MDKRQVEVRVLAIVEHVDGGGKIEDDFVEGKARWTEAKKTARQIAGSANAARGEPILWIIGLDEDGHRVVQLDDTDPSSWWEQVKTRFADGMTPAVQFVGVPTPYGFVMVLVFETDQSPYLVTTDGTGGIEREIPWREGTRVRSVRRAELLRLLTSRSEIPAVEAISLELSLTRGAGIFEPDKIRLNGELFFSVHTGHVAQASLGTDILDGRRSRRPDPDDTEVCPSPSKPISSEFAKGNDRCDPGGRAGTIRNPGQARRTHPRQL